MIDIQALPISGGGEDWGNRFVRCCCGNFPPRLKTFQLCSVQFSPVQPSSMLRWIITMSPGSLPSSDGCGGTKDLLSMTAF